MAVCTTEELIVDVNVTEYFSKSVTSAAFNQSIDTTEDALHYVVNLLTRFSEANRFFDGDHEGPRVTPLANLYARAVATESAPERFQAMRRLGDVSLFVAGLFSDSLQNRAVDIDYYIGMGGAAYAYVSDSIRANDRDRAYQSVFSELAAKFATFVDLLAEVGEKSVLQSNTDLLRLYEIWLKTGSKRAENKLREFGISPSEISGSNRRH